MKKILSLFAAILFAGSIFAAETVYKTASFAAANCTKSNKYEESSITCTVGTDVWTITNAANNSGGWDYIRMGAKKAQSSDPDKVTTSTITASAAYADPVTKVVITGSKLRGSFTSKLIIASDADFTADKVEITGPTAFTDGAIAITVASPVANRFYQIELVCTNTGTSSHGVLQLDKVEYYHESTEKVLTVNTASVDFGNVFTGSTVADKKVKVNFANLTGAVTYSSLSAPFAASGTIANDGDEITISASTATAGESSQTLTIQSVADSKSVTVTVHINIQDSIHVTSVALDQPTLTVEAGTRQRLVATVLPDNATNPALKWTTSDADVATVSNGSVLGVAAGNATITCQSKDDATKQAECNVTVTAALPKFVIDGSQLTSTATTEATQIEFTAVTDNTKTLTVSFSEGAKLQASAGDVRFSDAAILIGKKDKHIHNTTALPAKVTKFEIYYNKGASAAATASLDFSASPLTAAKETSDVTLAFSEVDKVYEITTVPSDARYFWYQVTNAYNTQVQFRIYYQTDPTAIDNTEVAEKAQKVIENGQLFIIKNGVKYNAQGAAIR